MEAIHGKDAVVRASAQTPLPVQRHLLVDVDGEAAIVGDDRHTEFVDHGELVRFQEINVGLPAVSTLRAAPP